MRGRCQEQGGCVVRAHYSDDSVPVVGMRRARSVTGPLRRAHPASGATWNVQVHYTLHLLTVYPSTYEYLLRVFKIQYNRLEC